MSRKPPQLPPRPRWHPPLPSEDVELWEEVKKSIKPLDPAAALRAKKRAEKKRLEHQEHDKAQVKAALPKKPAPQAVAMQPPVFRPKPEPQPEELDRVTARKIKRGHLAIEDRIDLHGMRQDNAHRRLEAFILDAHRRGLKLVLVITGKGTRSGDDGGILRKMVPQWLQGGALSRVVTGYKLADHRHGGEGALYVKLRRNRA